jgi:hypothetical protein
MLQVDGPEGLVVGASRVLQVVGGLFVELR